MSNLTQTELGKIRKAALHSVTISNEMKASVVDAKLKELVTEIKKIVTRKNVVLEILTLPV